jgi:glutamyl/glutaminyl-tRNA synthetase
LLSGLLCWLDARARGAEVWLRLEDLDPDRCRPDLVDALRRDLAWLGLEWDAVVVQSDRTARHEAALDRLATAGWLYPCSCSRSRLRALGRPAPDGGFAYDNRCRERALPPGGWRACTDPLRVRLPDEAVALHDEAGLDLSQHPARDLGDPVVRRRDGAVAYHLASVVDDAEGGMTRLIRGRDLAASAATQFQLRRRLGYAEPVLRHHFLLLEPRGEKLAKFHGAVGAEALRGVYPSERLVGLLAQWAGLRAEPTPCRPADLVDDFSWERVRADDLAVRWTGMELEAIR